MDLPTLAHPDVRRSRRACPAPSQPCGADDDRAEELLAKAGADYPLVRNMWPVPSQLISMSSFMSHFRCTLQSDVGAAKPLLCPRRPATVGHRRLPQSPTSAPTNSSGNAPACTKGTWYDFTGYSIGLM